MKKNIWTYRQTLYSIFYIMFLASNQSIALWEEILSADDILKETPHINPLDESKNTNNKINSKKLNTPQEKNQSPQSKLDNKSLISPDNNSASNHKNNKPLIDKENGIFTSPVKPENTENNTDNIDKKIYDYINNEIKDFGCEFVYKKYIVEKQIPKLYSSLYNWNGWSSFDITKYEDLFKQCK